MRQLRAIRLVAMAALLPAASLVLSPARAQQNNGLPLNMQVPIVQTESSIDPSDNRILQAQRLRALNKMRQKSLVKDTDRLLKLAQELNAPSAPGVPKMTDSERMKKLAQIEKLAKRVREQMSYANSASPPLLPPFAMSAP